MENIVWLVLVLLLPGVIAMKVHDVFIGGGKREFKDSLVSSAMYVLVVYGLLFLLGRVRQLGITPLPIGSEFNPWTLVWVLVIAACVGFAAGLSDERRFMLRVAKCLGARTRGWRSTWLDSFQIQGSKKWACVYLKDGTRVLGWVRYGANAAEEGSLFVARGDHGNEPVRLWPAGEDGPFPISGPGVLLAPGAEVSLVALLEGEEELVWGPV